MKCKAFIIVLILGWLMFSAGRLEKAEVMAATRCCNASECSPAANYSVTCVGVGSPCPPNKGTCYYTYQYATCLTWSAWGSCNLDPNGLCYQTRFCVNPSWLTTYQISQCACPTPTPVPATPTPTPTPTPVPNPSCTVDLLPASASVAVGSKTSFDASVANILNGTISQVNFSSLNTSIATVFPLSDSSPVYSTEATGVNVGSTTIRAGVIMSGAERCFDTSAITVTLPGPWWQVKDADVTTNGNLISPIPASCTLPACNPVFGLKGTGGFPGVPAYGGTTADFQAGAGTGNAAEAPYNWLASSSYQGKIYDYAYFARQIPSDVAFTEITTPTVNGGDFNSGGAPSRGYVWYHYNGATLGNMIISGNINLTGSRRVVLLVEGADLYITGRIGIQSSGNGFFMAVVGKDANGLKGNIIVDPAVSHPTSPGLEGIFVAEREFRTGAGTSQLWVRGSVVAYDGFLLQRNLNASNSTKPAELFEYAPELMSVFPQVFTTRRMRWKEVAP